MITKTPLELLLPYQRTWVQDNARFKIGLMARQIGKSFACAAEAVRDCLTRPGTMWIVLSAGERQALEFMEKAKQWSEAFQLTIASYTEERDSTDALIKNAEIRWQNKSRMLALPANPNTARGYSANLILDEFAFHERPEEIWRAIYPSISNPLKGQYKLRIVSTPRGQNNKFHDLWTGNTNYSRHFIDIHTAVAQGLPLNVEELRAGLNDPEGWAQEFECQFIDSSSVLLPYELIASCETDEIAPESQSRFIGIDIGRKHDLTVIWTLVRVGDVLWTEEVHVLEKTPFHEQIEVIIPRIARATRVCIDSTGIGSMMAEELTRLHSPYRIESCNFSTNLKEELFYNLRRHFDEKKLRIPISRTIREDLHSLQKTVTNTGAIRYTAPHNQGGHSDRSAALALALRASLTPETAANFRPLHQFSRLGEAFSTRKNRTL